MGFASGPHCNLSNCIAKASEADDLGQRLFSLCVHSRLGMWAFVERSIVDIIPQAIYMMWKSSTSLYEYCTASQLGDAASSRRQTTADDDKRYTT